MNSIVVANWKMNPGTLKEAKVLFEATRKAVDTTKGVSVIVAPPAIFLRDLSRSYKGRRITFAAQNAHFEQGGSFTGETSLAQARDAKATAVIVGHAERRAGGETNDDTRKKVSAAIVAQLTPILCVGEQKRAQGGEHFTTIKEQLRAGLADVPAAKLSKMIIAYEPVWAIGADKPMSPRDMHEMTIFIHKMIVESHGQAGMNVRILYGGAVDETNALEMISDGHVHGLLVGRASTNAFKFKHLLESLA